MKAKALKAKTEVKKALEVLAALVVLAALTRAATVTWYNNSDVTGFPLDRVVAGITLTLVFTYFIWIHYKKG